MPKPRQRTCLNQGLKLDLNKLCRQGLVRPGCRSGPRGIRWSSDYWGEIASGVITANLEDKYEGWLRVQLEKLDQQITLIPRPRHFGGHQWYFICPAMNRDCSVVWLPPGANRFCSRQKWGGRRVAYATQFADPDNRAHIGQAKIKAKLIGDLDPDQWDLPPKPKWMRWKTYNRYVERFDTYEAILEDGIEELLAKFFAE
jgi:hypothetical protein